MRVKRKGLGRKKRCTWLERPDARTSLEDVTLKLRSEGVWEWALLHSRTAAFLHVSVLRGNGNPG
jgi:hypothetical protein